MTAFESCATTSRRNATTCSFGAREKYSASEAYLRDRFFAVFFFAEAFAEVFFAAFFLAGFFFAEAFAEVFFAAFFAFFLAFREESLPSFFLSLLSLAR